MPLIAPLSGALSVCSCEDITEGLSLRQEIILIFFFGARLRGRFDASRRCFIAAGVNVFLIPFPSFPSSLAALFIART
jgi:hypothetical protein